MNNLEIYEVFSNRLKGVEKDINDIKLKMNKSAKLFDCFL